ncbi:TetR/AcrR family transcriptional regulator [Solicola gregarius]|uniref:TetR/AcrR family transcriptional regulator n=1 Tax=Solicola gregarius TaxID=2908642 RepID=A0AA46YK97_9ACTN|nr:TetR/AcrR family transcriptional regulator [Solicola gregarius]UYM04256.1 TetR/AcrR family transcriptional regulator [Solicola gregarius]
MIDAAVEAFAERGFHATTTRDIAARAGMSPAALYVHHASKEQVLYEVSRLGHEGALAAVRDAVEGIDSPVDRLAAYVRAFTWWHAEHHTRARIVQYELDSLSPEHYQEVAAMRREIDDVLRGVLLAGVRDRSFDLEEDDVPGTAVALLSLGIDVSRWFRDDGSRSAPDIAERYAELAVRMAGAR